jgi:hypothetical protein
MQEHGIGTVLVLADVPGITSRLTEFPGIGPAAPSRPLHY